MLVSANVSANNLSANDLSANPWVTNARSRRNLYEPRADGGRADQPRRARLRHFFAPAERAYHLPDRAGRGRHVDAGRRAAVVPGSGKPEEGNLNVHQLARRRGDIGAGNLRHHAVHSAAGIDAVHGAGGLDGLAAALRRREGHALLAAELADYGAPAL